MGSTKKTKQKPKPLKPSKSRVEADRALADALVERIRVGNEAACENLRRLVRWQPSVFPYVLEDPGEPSASVPLLSEAMLYPLLGKQEARTFLGLLEDLALDLGFTGLWDPDLDGVSP